MSANKLQVPPEFKSAPKDQQIDFVHDLWDQIAQDPGSVPVSESHKKILKERLDAFRASPNQGKPWDQVRDELLGKIGKD